MPRKDHEPRQLAAIQRQKALGIATEVTTGTKSPDDLIKQLRLLLALQQLEEPEVTAEPTPTPVEIEITSVPRRSRGANFSPEYGDIYAYQRDPLIITELIRRSGSKFVHKSHQSIASTILKPECRKDHEHLRRANIMITFQKRRFALALIGGALLKEQPKIKAIADEQMREIIRTEGAEGTRSAWYNVYSYLFKNYGHLTATMFVKQVLYRFPGGGYAAKRVTKEATELAEKIKSRPKKEKPDNSAYPYETEFIACGLFIQSPQTIQAVSEVIGYEPLLKLVKGNGIIPAQATDLTLQDISSALSEHFASQRERMVLIEKTLDPTTHPIRADDHKPLIANLIANHCQGVPGKEISPKTHPALHFICDLAEKNPAQAQELERALLFSRRVIIDNVTNPFGFRIVRD